MAQALPHDATRSLNRMQHRGETIDALATAGLHQIIAHYAHQYADFRQENASPAAAAAEKPGLADLWSY
jgi:hypothetical protein